MTLMDKVVRIAGAIFLALLLYKTLRFFSLHLALYGDKKLDRYKCGRQEPWALVTGASAGIGFAYAQELASRGFAVILLGHNSDELQQAEDRLRPMPGQSQTKVVTLNAITASPAEVESVLHPVTRLNLKILINNVGGILAQPTYKELTEYTANEVDSMIDLNARFMAHVTRILLPVLQQNGPSLILHMSSGSHLGMPWICIYSGVKGFNASFGRAVSREAKATNMAVESIVIAPGDVQSQANAHGLAPFSPTAREYAKITLDRVVTAVRQGRNEMNPYWMHDLSGLCDFVPEFLLQKFGQESIVGKMRVCAELAQKKQ